eukprot:TRINITY_DN8327_c1_g1_i1.p1 TRINITY_DN8327_c1_g1~~TRINITY_DN8327_c1_g1_i1.p1  ORF type:complete len:697 (+),score=80.05 TRINITY_DN8327_c1_g1_i1:59-2149(+)
MATVSEIDKLLSDSLSRIESLVLSEHSTLKGAVHSALRRMGNQLDNGADSFSELLSPPSLPSPRHSGQLQDKEHDLNSELGLGEHPLAPALLSPVLPSAPRVSPIQSRTHPAEEIRTTSIRSTCSARISGSLSFMGYEISGKTLTKRSSGATDMSTVKFAMRTQFSKEAEKGTGRLFRKMSSLGTSQMQTRFLEESQNPLKGSGWHLHSVLPDSHVAKLWDVLACLCVLHDFVVLPLQVFYQDGKGFSSPAAIPVSVYWLLNVILRFFIGYLDEHGHPVTDLGGVARRYAKSWLAFDVIMVAVDMSSLVLKHADGFRFLLALRLMRMLRLVRVSEIATLLRSWIQFQLQLQVRSEGLHITVGIVRIILTILCVAHLFTCCWYFAGTQNSEKNWPRAQNVDHESVLVRYLVGFNWALGQFSGDSRIDPNNFTELVFTCGIQFIAFVISAIIVSDLTTLRTQLQLVRAQSNHQIHVLQHFLLSKNISTRLASRILGNARLSIDERKRKPPEHTVALLKQISTPLLTELHYSANADYLKVHPFFARYDTCNRAAMKNICHLAVKMDIVSQGDVLYSVGEVMQDPRMYFATNNGCLLYSINGAVRELMEGLGVNEVPFWILDWMQLGTLQMQAASHVVSIVVHTAVEVMTQFRTKHFYPGRYARCFFQEISHTNFQQLTDIASDFVSLDSIADTAFSASL